MFPLLHCFRGYRPAYTEFTQLHRTQYNGFEPFPSFDTKQITIPSLGKREAWERERKGERRGTLPTYIQPMKGGARATAVTPWHKAAIDDQLQGSKSPQAPPVAQGQRLSVELSGASPGVDGPVAVLVGLGV